MDDMIRAARELEWSEYARTAFFATVIPDVEVRISSEVILVTDPQMPMVEGNHAAMLRTTPDRADALIERIIQHYQDRDLTPYVAISPNCSPDDLPQRLLAHGFKQHAEPEQWLTLKDAWYAEALRGSNQIAVREIGQDGLVDFCQVMVTAFDLPPEVVPLLTRHFGDINDLPGVHNYVAYLEGKPIGCMSLFSYIGYSVVGSAGVLPGLRHTGAAFSLIAQCYQDYKKSGSKVLAFQTMLPKLARMFRIGGCKHIFTRTYYALE